MKVRSLVVVVTMERKATTVEVEVKIWDLTSVWMQVERVVVKDVTV